MVSPLVWRRRQVGNVRLPGRPRVFVLVAQRKGRCSLEDMTAMARALEDEGISATSGLCWSRALRHYERECSLCLLKSSGWCEGGLHFSQIESPFIFWACVSTYFISPAFVLSLETPTGFETDRRAQWRWVPTTSTEKVGRPTAEPARIPNHSPLGGNRADAAGRGSHAVLPPPYPHGRPLRRTRPIEWPMTRRSFTISCTVGVDPAGSVC